MSRLIAMDGPHAKLCPALGAEPGAVGDPVNVVTGDNFDVFRELNLFGPLPLDFRRHYSSGRCTIMGKLGWGHTHSLDRTLAFDADGISYYPPMSGPVRFSPLTRDGESVSGNGLTLRRMTMRTFSLRISDAWYEFDFNKLSMPARLARIRRSGAQISFSYSSSGTLKLITDSMDREIRVSNDSSDRLTALELQLPEKQTRTLLRFKYDEAGNLVEGGDFYKSKFSFTYDANNRMLSKTDRLSYTFYYEYDRHGRCTRSRGQDGLYDVRLEYRPQESCTIVTRHDGGKWIWSYDESGRIQTVTDPLGGATVYRRDKRGRVIDELDPLGNATRYSYGPAGDFRGKITPTNAFIPAGQMRPSYDPHKQRIASNPWEWEYGSLSGYQEGLPFNDSPILDSLEPWLRRLITTVPNPLNQPPKPKPSPEPLLIRDGDRVLDLNSHVVKRSGPNDTARRWTYDANGNIRKFVDFDGAALEFGYESWDLRASVINSVGARVALRFNETRHVRSFTDAGGTKSEYRYDLKDRLVGVSRHGRLRDKYVRDLAGNLIQKLDANGEPLLTCEYGPRNQIISRTLASGGTHRFEYDDYGRCKSAATADFTVEFKYDLGGRRVADLRDGRGVEHIYRGGRLVQTTILGKFVIQYQTDGPNKLRITDPTGAVQTLRKLGNGIIERTLPNGTVEWGQYDDKGRCLLKASKPADARSVPRSCRYTYSAEGDLLKSEDNSLGTTQYGYDAAHRLVEIIPTDQAQQKIALDAAGNILEMPGLRGASYAEGNRIVTANGDTFEHNARNHVSSRRSTSGRTQYHYDSRDQLVAVESESMAWFATYDPLVRRLSKSFGNRRIEYFWDRERIVAEVDEAEHVRIYIYADELTMTPLGFVVFESLDAAASSGSSRWILCGQLATPLRVEDELGSTLWSVSISPYGIASHTVPPRVELDLRFPGHQYDAETGLHFNRFRYYAPQLGRYLQSDPVGIGGGDNVYNYSRPLSSVDVRGLCPNDDAPSPEDKEDEEELPPTVRPPPPEEPEPAVPPNKEKLSDGKYAGQGIPMTGHGQGVDSKYPVQIFTPEQLENYRIVAADDGRLVYNKTGEPVNGSKIYTMDQDGNMYAADPVFGKVHHSSLAGGQQPVAAGVLVADNGSAVHMDDGSGHYGGNAPAGRPQVAADEMKSQGVNPPPTAEDKYNK